MKYILTVFILLIVLSGSTLASDFDAKKADWLARNGKGFNNAFPKIKENDPWAPRYYVFAWLEKGIEGPCTSATNDGSDYFPSFDCTDEVVLSFINPPGGRSFFDNSGLPNVQGAARVYYQYGDQISDTLRTKLA